MPAPYEGVKWHAISAADALARLETSSDGLAEIDATLRLKTYGPNALKAPRAASVWAILNGQLRSVVVILLVSAAALAVLTGDTKSAVAIIAVLVINLVLGFTTELRARRAMESLLALQVQRATVVREGRLLDVDARELVPGDVVTVEAGQNAPADARLINAVALRTSEATLSGESLPVGKRADVILAADAPLPDRTNMLYQATSVVAGGARAVVVATGMATEVGRISALVGGIAQQPTPLERRLDTLGRRLAGVALFVAAIVAALSLLQGESLTTVLRIGIAVGIAAVPEGLPAVVTITMAVGVRRMARRHALVRRLPTVESLGSATVICTDKTGTLTAGEVTVTTMWVDGRELRVTGSGYAPAGSFLQGNTSMRPSADICLTRALRIGALANRAGLVRVEGRWEPRGDPTEAALLAVAQKAGIERRLLLEALPEVGEIPFSSERMLMATYHRSPQGTLVAHVKGAPGRIIELSDRLLTARGEERLDAGGRATLLSRNQELAVRGLRVLALADGPVLSMNESDLKALSFVGFAGMMDPPAPGVPETIRLLREAGIRTVMLTGDQRLTAEAIARTVGVMTEGDETLDGQDVDQLKAEELRTRVGRVAAYSRVSPEAKLRIVSALQSEGEIVAMLGDGVNDAAALRKADVGVSMGRGTDVAKEAAGVVIADDRFETIAAAVEEGRVIFDNIRKFVFYLFSCNLAEIFVLLGAGVAGLPLPLLPIQLLWLNLLTDTFPALALALEPAEPNVMHRPPRHPQSAILSRSMLRETAAYSVLIAACTLGAFVWGLRGSTMETPHAITLSFMTLALAQLFHLGNARSVTAVIQPHRALANLYALGAVVLGLALQLLAIYYAPLANVLSTTRLTAGDWLIVTGLASVPAVVGQATKMVRSRPPKLRPSVPQAIMKS